ncbi:alkylation response protein AidB-like acyl-CoA dehydrogenase [Nocardioides sp. J9]|uniref:acyl-CoA dehydrogenase family protein n=1 Tax=Nocardioides sp. J9 TaxID=935844 RepID=UPI0011AA37D7|nr:acyl-CoA dehydrogenase family protein [Nocardioides sp. J9]TWG99267.1 alkylation response protein AidB-like acyl-CoA dehydrogenase [Nocardioides sp. J9]
MDFLFTPEQDEAAELAAQILADRTTNDRLKQVEAGGDRFDLALWKELDDAGLLTLHLPEEHGGAGLGLVELARVLVEVGKRVAPVPLAVHGSCTALLAEHGVAPDAGVYAAAVAEERTHLPAVPTVTATADGALTGTKTLVRAGMAADALLVTATGPDGPAVHLVDVSATGVERVAQHTSDGDVAAMVTLAGAPSTRVGDATAAARLGQLLVALAAAEQLGVTEGALRLTADYAKTREQFGRPIGTFQAVSQRLADGFIDVLGQRLTLWQAVWRLQEGLPAATEVATAKLWAADAGHRIAHTTVHVHGGVGIDLDGEAHRYFTSGKRFEFLFGGATEQALAIGRTFA